MIASPGRRFRENVTKIAGTIVTGIWLAALFSGQDWWLAALLFGYVVVVPVVAILFGDEVDGVSLPEDERTVESSTDSDNRDALERLGHRYARWDLTDEQFE